MGRMTTGGMMDEEEAGKGTVSGPTDEVVEEAHVGMARVPVVIKRDDTMRVKYRCSDPKCRAEDVVKYFSDEPVAKVTTCNECGAGRGLDIQTMLKRGKGMFAVVPETVMPGQGDGEVPGPRLVN